MSRFVQSLESRKLFSAAPVAAAVLLADAKQVVAAAGTARADLGAAMTAVAADTNTVATDLKTSTTITNRAINAGLLTTLKHDELKTFATLRAHETALLVVSTGLSNRAAADGKALLLSPTNAKLQARVSADVTALATVPAMRLATLQADAQNTVLGVDLTHLVNANPANTSLATDANAFQTGGTAAVAIGNVITAAGAFTTVTAKLNADVNLSTSGSTIANLVGTYTGSATDVAGNHNNQGLVSTLILNITSEGADGSWTGTATSTIDGNTATETESLTGSVKADGSFTATLTDPSGQNSSGTLVGTVSGKTLTGTTFDGSNTAAQTFVLTMQ